MVLKKSYFTHYGRKGGTVEITVRDDSGAKIESHNCQISDKKRTKQIFKTLKEKYGIAFSPEIEVEDSVNYDDVRDQFLGKDLEW